MERSEHPLASYHHASAGPRAALCRVRGYGPPNRAPQYPGVRAGNPVVLLARRYLAETHFLGLAGAFDRLVVLRYSRRGRHVAAGRIGRLRGSSALVSPVHGLFGADPGHDRPD